MAVRPLSPLEPVTIARTTPGGLGGDPSLLVQQTSGDAAPFLQCESGGTPVASIDSAGNFTGAGLSVDTLYADHLADTNGTTWASPVTATSTVSVEWPLDLTEQSAPASPAAGALRLYAGTDHALHVKTNGGTDTALGAGGSGNTTYTNAYASPPSSPANGDQWWPSDGMGIIFIRVSGAWVPYYRGEPAVTPPNAASWSWYNQNGSAISDVKGALQFVSGGSTGTNSSMIYKSLAVATPYVLTARIIPLPPFNTNTDWGLGVRESSSGKYQSLTWQNGAMNIYEWTNNSTVSGNGSVSTTAQLGAPDWFQIQDDGTNRLFRVGWQTKGLIRQLFSKGRTAFCTPDQWGFVFDNQGAPSPYAAWMIVSAQES